MKVMWQAAGLQTVLAASVMAGACALALTVGWKDWQRLAGLPPKDAPVQSNPESGPEITSAAHAVRSAARERLPDVPLFAVADAAATAATAAPPPPADEAELPESAASFEVFGLIEASDPARSRAILGATEAEQREYRVGEPAPDGSRLHAIRPRALVLERAGQLEVMKLPEPETEGAAPVVRRRFLPRPVARVIPPLPDPDDAALRLPAPDGLPPD
jgi:hypothetical protein